METERDLLIKELEETRKLVCTCVCVCVLRNICMYVNFVYLSVTI